VESFYPLFNDKIPNINQTINSILLTKDTITPMPHITSAHVCRRACSIKKQGIAVRERKKPPKNDMSHVNATTLYHFPK
jgi:hypothetical protein